MRAAMGFAGVHAVLIACGLALLYALGLVSRLRQVPWAIGPAYLAGLAAVFPVLILLLVIEVPVRLAHFCAVSLALTVAFAGVGFAASRRGRPADEPPAIRPRGIEAWLTGIALAALVLFFAIGATSFANLPTVGDDWTIWSYKALAFFHFDGSLHPETFLQGPQGAAHPDYPILQPLLESIFFRAMDGPHLQEFHVALWIVFGAFVWTVAYLVRSRGIGTPLLLAGLGALAVSPGAASVVTQGYADVTVAALAAAGALSFGLWIDDGRARYALLGAVFLGAAANTKNEGLAAAGVVLVVAGAIVLLSRPVRWRAWLGAAAIVVAAAAPWSIWRSSHDLQNPDMTPLGHALDWGFLSDRFDRLEMAFGKLMAQLANQGAWVWLVPCFLVLAVACLATRPDLRRQAAFYLATATLMLLSAVWVYWTGTLAVESWLYFSANRIVTSTVFVCGAGLLHLAGRTLVELRPAPAGQPAAPS